MYNIDSLLAGIESAKKNIKTFEEAIAREYKTITEYRQMIEVLERKKFEADQAKRSVHVVIEKEEDSTE